jgi:uncharacterized membrane protein HdeD (DUF308 family)
METPAIAFSGTPVRWWQVTIIGFIISISGVYAFFLTPAFIGILVTLFGILAFAVGTIMVIFSFTVREQGVYRFPILVAGALSLLVAGIAIFAPGIIQASFILIMAFIAIINSILMILVGCSLSDKWKMRLVVVLFGMVILFLGILMVLFPMLSFITLVKIWGVYAWVVGALCIIAGLSMRALNRTCMP